MIELSKIRIDGGTQSRVELNKDTVAEYADAYAAGVQMPPVVLFYDGSSFWLADGFHRFFGAKAAGLVEIHEERQPGTQRDAVLYSLSANAKHGLRRSNADKRRAVGTLLADPEWSTWSDNDIAKRCSVSNHLVADVKKSILENSKIEGENTASSTNNSHIRTVTRNGKTYEQNTANIGTGPDPAKAAVTASTKTASSPKINVPAAAESVPSAQSELEELRARYDEMAASFKETLAENESLGRVFDSDDRVAAGMAEVKRFAALNAVLESRLTSLMNELAEAIRLAKSWKRRAEKSETALTQLEASHAG